MKRGAALRSVDEKRAYIRDCRPAGLSVVDGCRLMAIARSSFHAATRQLTDEATIIAAMTAIADEFEAYG